MHGETVKLVLTYFYLSLLLIVEPTESNVGDIQSMYLYNLLSMYLHIISSFIFLAVGVTALYRHFFSTLL